MQFSALPVQSVAGYNHSAASGSGIPNWPPGYKPNRPTDGGKPRVTLRTIRFPAHDIAHRIAGIPIKLFLFRSAGAVPQSNRHRPSFPAPVPPASRITLEHGNSSLQLILQQLIIRIEQSIQLLLIRQRRPGNMNHHMVFSDSFSRFKT